MFDLETAIQNAIGQLDDSPAMSPSVPREVSIDFMEAVASHCRTWAETMRAEQRAEEGG